MLQVMKFPKLSILFLLWLSDTFISGVKIRSVRRSQSKTRRLGKRAAALPGLDQSDIFTLYMMRELNMDNRDDFDSFKRAMGISEPAMLDMIRDLQDYKYQNKGEEPPMKYVEEVILKRTGVPRSHLDETLALYRREQPPPKPAQTEPVEKPMIKPNTTTTKATAGKSTPSTKKPAETPKPTPANNTSTNKPAEIAKSTTANAGKTSTSVPVQQKSTAKVEGAVEGETLEERYNRLFPDGGSKATKPMWAANLALIAIVANACYTFVM